MLTYSIAIRTLGTAGDKFREELKSIYSQSIQPEKVLIYIAEGYDRPDFKIGREEYIWVEKGMMRQRLLEYNEIESDVIFFLDDDIQLASDTTEKMLKEMEENGLDAIGADIFENHKRSLFGKFHAALTGLVFPHRNQRWAFKIQRNGSFSYLNNPKKAVCLSQSCGGPVWMIRKRVYDNLFLPDELWLDDLIFPYGEDALQAFKIYKNGYRLGILFDSGCINLNAASSSEGFRKGNNWMQTRTLAIFAVWWRTIYQTAPSRKERILAVSSFTIKAMWMFFLSMVLSIVRLSPRVFIQNIKGMIEGWRMVHSQKFKNMRPYIIER